MLGSCSLSVCIVSVLLLLCGISHANAEAVVFEAAVVVEVYHIPNVASLLGISTSEKETTYELTTFLGPLNELELNADTDQSGSVNRLRFDDCEPACITAEFGAVDDDDDEALQVCAGEVIDEESGSDLTAEIVCFDEAHSFMLSRVSSASGGELVITLAFEDEEALDDVIEELINQRGYSTVQDAFDYIISLEGCSGADEHHHSAH